VDSVKISQLARRVVAPEVHVELNDLVPGHWSSILNLCGDLVQFIVEHAVATAGNLISGRVERLRRAIARMERDEVCPAVFGVLGGGAEGDCAVEIGVDEGPDVLESSGKLVGLQISAGWLSD
jgi:hypothetical protein